MNTLFNTPASMSPRAFSIHLELRKHADDPAIRSMKHYSWILALTFTGRHQHDLPRTPWSVLWDLDMMKALQEVSLTSFSLAAGTLQGLLSVSHRANMREPLTKGCSTGRTCS